MNGANRANRMVNTMTEQERDFDTVTVGLGDRSYDIIIGHGLLDKACDWIKPLLHEPSTIIVTDENVAKYHLDPLKETLEKSGITVQSIVVPAGEKSKSLTVFADVCEQILKIGVHRKSTLIALGGGVIGDLVGYVSASLLRGIDFIQIPTTLLAQVDSSVGGKTGINAQAGKNLIGAFHQPKLVLIDCDTLDSLPMREMRSGYAEVLKYGAIDNFTFFEWLETNGQSVLDGHKENRHYAIKTSVESKSRIVSADEKENGIRALLNLGHTFGHALENTTGYDNRLYHGEAVAIGMVMAHALSVELGTCDGQDVKRLVSHLEAIGLPTSLDYVSDIHWKTEDLVQIMRKDKKNIGDTMTFIVSKGIGNAFIVRDVDVSKVEFVLNQFVK